MTDEEIINYPDKIELVKTLLKRLTINTNRMYELEGKVRDFQPDETHKRLRDLEESLEKIGITGTRQWYCTTCKCRVTATKNLSLGVGWICETCQHPAIRIADIDPVVTKRELEHSIQEQHAQLSLIQKLDREIAWYRENGKTHPGKKHDFVDPNDRAKRSLEL